MAQKIVNIDGIGETLLIRRRGAKHIRLSFDSRARLRLTLPYFIPYSVGISFAKSKKSWIKNHQPKIRLIKYYDNQKIGKCHKLSFSKEPLKNDKSVVLKNNVIYFYGELNPSSINKLETTVNKCLKDEAVELLPSRLNKLADKFGYSYKDVKIKKMHSRWGSCSNLKVIALSYYLVQLPWDLIDYVLLHELVHTKHMNHSASFWAELAISLPDVKNLRKQLKPYQPTIF